jgi:hypothetical protein
VVAEDAEAEARSGRHRLSNSHGLASHGRGLRVESREGSRRVGVARGRRPGLRVGGSWVSLRRCGLLD